METAQKKVKKWGKCTCFMKERKIHTHTHTHMLIQAHKKHSAHTDKP